MKKTLHYLSILSILVAWLFSMNLLAQESVSSFGKAPHQVPAGKQEFAPMYHDAVTTGYGADGIANQWYSVAIPGGAPTIIGPTGGTLHQGGDFDGAGTFYAVRSPSTLMTVDVMTGTETALGLITGVTGGQTITSISWNDANSTMYIGTTNITTSELYTIDLSTRVATLVGTVTNCPGLIAVATNCAGQMFGVDLVNDNLVSIDPSSGAGTILGPLGYNANFAQDADFDSETGTLYLAAYNGTSSAGELRTADLATGNTTLVVSWGAVEITSFGIVGTCGPPCPIDPPSNPNPPSGATDVSINPGNATWTNGAGATSIEVYFGELGSLAMVYSGAPITSLAIPGPLNYNTAYGWRVVGLNDTCQVSGPTWTFTTEQDPDLVTLFFDDFEAGIGLWTVTNNGGTCDWEVLSPPFPNAYTLPATATGNLLAADSDECGSGTTMNTTATVTAPIDASMYQSVELYFDNDWRHIGSGDEAHVEISTDGGSTWSSVWSQIGVSVRNSTEFIDLSPVVGLTTFNLRFRSVQPGWDWWWVVDNVKVIGFDVIPVELASFTATSVDNKVTLNWTTATETNNSGFQVERSNGSEFQAVGFVTGHGTTTEAKSYSFIDAGLKPGAYTYRLKQVDHNGQFEYSNTIEVDVVAPKEYTLNQNYPNPFNPSTMITFNLAVDSKVSLKVFDVLGQQVMTLVNNNLSAGAHEYNFDASGLNSGVYFYRIEASGVDGQNFTSVKKMILTK